MTQELPPVPIRVRLAKGQPGEDSAEFTAAFTLGRSPDCDVQLDHKLVSGHHASVVWEDGAWWIRDLNSRNGTYLDGRLVTRAQLPSTCTVSFARNGPVIHLDIVRPSGADLERTRVDTGGLTVVAEHYFGDKPPQQMGEKTQLIQRAFKTIQKREKKHYRTIIGVIAVLLVLAAAGLWYQSRRVERLEQLHGVAANMFYSMKSLELQLAKLRVAVAKTADEQLQKELAAKAAELRALEDDYDSLIREELGVSLEEMPEDEWLIYRVARVFGECDVAMPDDFKIKVKEYIAKWRSTGRMKRALELAFQRGFAPRIVKRLDESGMPQQFFYLAMQESNFNTRICGPPTRYGIAKGMWQFIPITAEKYGLSVGPRAESPEYDPADERHDFEKSTEAAASYLRDLYQTEAQGSGLLVMACYNWGEHRVLDLVLKMPENPKDRNFWNLIKQYRIPEETYDYVFYIIAAAVIGENPRLFGFDFDPPLSRESLAPATVVKAGGADSLSSGLPAGAALPAAGGPAVVSARPDTLGAPGDSAAPDSAGGAAAK